MRRAIAARSDAHDLALDIAEGRPGQHGMARALERFIGHVIGEQVGIRPVPVIDDRSWSWHVGLDAEATAIANDLWQGAKVPQARLARAILWLGVLEFAEASRVLPRPPPASRSTGAGDGCGAAGTAEAAGEPGGRQVAAEGPGEAADGSARRLF